MLLVPPSLKNSVCVILSVVIPWISPFFSGHHSELPPYLVNVNGLTIPRSGFLPEGTQSLNNLIQSHGFNYSLCAALRINPKPLSSNLDRFTQSSSE